MNDGIIWKLDQNHFRLLDFNCISEQFSVSATRSKPKKLNLKKRKRKKDRRKKEGAKKEIIFGFDPG